MKTCEMSATALVARLQEKRYTLAAAESCTGGWFAKTVVDVPGASAVFCGGVVSYTNAIKERLLGVPADLLATYTAVSAPVAAAMARGVRGQTGADLGISVTGLAGPDGGTEETPVGRVYIGLSCKTGEHVTELTLPGDRTAVRCAAVCHMIHVLLKFLA